MPCCGAIVKAPSPCRWRGIACHRAARQRSRKSAPSELRQDVLRFLHVAGTRRRVIAVLFPVESTNSGGAEDLGTRSVHASRQRECAALVHVNDQGGLARIILAAGNADR